MTTTTATTTRPTTTKTTKSVVVTTPNGHTHQPTGFFHYIFHGLLHVIKMHHVRNFLLHWKHDHCQGDMA
jgi:hypothetical protein